jgi:lysine 2,3-aminomutase
VAGQKYGNFPELISPFLQGKLTEARASNGEESAAYQAIARQYMRSDLEAEIQPLDRRRHYEAEVTSAVNGKQLKGVERLYRRTVLLEPTTACAAHCRWCLRGQYGSFTLREADVDCALDYFALDSAIREVLITGGDPLMAPRLLAYILNGIDERVPNIEIVRIGTRVPLQAPERISGELLTVLQARRLFRLELGIHICHPSELWPESRRVLQILLASGIRIYNQHPLLKGVNDDRDTLIALYDEIRRLGIEAHYLFHAIPMRGMTHHRTSIERGLELISALTSGGEFSGRAKPHYCAMTDIGKVVLYHGSILKRDADTASVLLHSQYRAADRLRYNPSWQIPSSVIVDENGFMNVWYPDGADDLPPAHLHTSEACISDEAPR